jgi:hypothetical protein
VTDEGAVSENGLRLYVMRLKSVAVEVDLEKQTLSLVNILLCACVIFYYQFRRNRPCVTLSI